MILQRNVIELAIEQEIHTADPRLGIIPLVLRVVEEFPANAIPYHELQEVITNYCSSRAESRSDPVASSASGSGTGKLSIPKQQIASQTIYSAVTGEAVGRSGGQLQIAQGTTVEERKDTEQG